MDGTWSCLVGRKHDILAGSFAVVSMIFLLQLLAGKSGTTVDQVVVANTAPASLGTLVDESDAPDAFARAGETTDSPADVEEPSAPLHHESVEPSSYPSELATNVEDNSNNEINARAEASPNDTRSEMPAEQKTPVDSLVTNTSGPEPQLQSTPSTPVESAPKPVEQMTAAELQQAVEAYEKWVHEGQIKLFLDYSRLPIQQLDSITMLYVARTTHSTILVSPNGSVQDLGKTEAPTGKLIGDLSRDRTKWPPVLAARARERFGSAFMADASFVLTDSCTVIFYRTLAQALGNKEPRPGMEFVLQLQLNGQQIEVKLDHHK